MPAGAPYIRIVFWDVGGVLSRDALEPHRRDLEQAYGLPLSTLDAYHDKYRFLADYGAITDCEYWQRMLAGAGIPAERIAADQTNICAIAPYVEAVPGAFVVLKALHNQGYPTGILSDDSYELAEARAESLGYGTLVPPALFVISSYYHEKKPFPEIYDIAFASARAAVGDDLVPEQVLFIDDNPKNIAGALRMGWQVLLFETAGQCTHELKEHFGIDAANDPAPPEMRALRAAARQAESRDTDQVLCHHTRPLPCDPIAPFMDCFAMETHGYDAALGWVHESKVRWGPEAWQEAPAGKSFSSRGILSLSRLAIAGNGDEEKYGFTSAAGRLSQGSDLWNGLKFFVLDALMQAGPPLIRQPEYAYGNLYISVVPAEAATECPSLSPPRPVATEKDAFHRALAAFRPSPRFDRGAYAIPERVGALGSAGHAEAFRILPGPYQTHPADNPTANQCEWGSGAWQAITYEPSLPIVDLNSTPWFDSVRLACVRVFEGDWRQDQLLLQTALPMATLVKRGLVTLAADVRHTNHVAIGWGADGKTLVPDTPVAITLKLD